MAASYSVTTSATDLKEVWKKVQAGIVVAFQFGVEEWNWLNKLKRFDVDELMAVAAVQNRMLQYYVQGPERPAESSRAKGVYVSSTRSMVPAA